MKRSVFLYPCLLLSLTLGWTGQALAAASCPAVGDITPLQLQGQWLIQLKTQAQTWRLNLKPHPEHIGSLRGELDTGTHHFLVVADWDEGDFTMEETHDGQRIAATWLGSAIPDHCGQTLTGERETAQGAKDSFEMRRKSSK